MVDLYPYYRNKSSSKPQMKLKDDNEIVRCWPHRFENELFPMPHDWL